MEVPTRVVPIVIRRVVVPFRAGDVRKFKAGLVVARDREIGVEVAVVGVIDRCAGLFNEIERARPGGVLNGANESGGGGVVDAAKFAFLCESQIDAFVVEVGDQVVVALFDLVHCFNPCFVW